MERKGIADIHASLIKNTSMSVFCDLLKADISRDF